MYLGRTIHSPFETREPTESTLASVERIQKLLQALRSMSLHMLIVVITSSIHNSLHLINRNLRLAIKRVQPINLLLDITPTSCQ